MHKLGLASALLCALVLVLAPPATADDTVCVGALTGVFDNVVVPPAAECPRSNSIVHGNVKVLEGATLVLSWNIIHGNVQASYPETVSSNADRIGGDFEVVGATHSADIIHGEIGGNISVQKSTGAVRLLRTFVDGNVIAEDNVPTDLSVSRIDAAGALAVHKNRGAGVKRVVGNFAAVVACTENDPPFVGGPNIGPSHEGQCFGIPGSPPPRPPSS